MGTFTTDVPTSDAGAKPKRGGADTLESEAIGLEISVRIHGSQVAAVVLEATEHVEPFEEDTSTMIVFPRGAVVKLRARVRTSHAVVLTNLTTKQTALCRIIQVNSTANALHYVKLEFIQPVPGFWGVHFPSDAKVPSVAREDHAPPKKELEKPTAPPPMPAKNVASMNVPPPAQSLPRLDTPLPAEKPFTHGAAKEAPKPVPAPPMNYGIAEHAQTNEVEPLATVPPKKTPLPKAQPTTPVPPLDMSAKAFMEAPVFDSLSTGEEVFGKDAVAAPAEEAAIFKSDQKAAQAFVRPFDPSSLLQGGEAPKRHTGLKVVLSLAAVAFLAAGAVYYVRQYRGSARQSASPTATVSIPHAAPVAATGTTRAQTPIGSAPPSIPDTASSSDARTAPRRQPVQAPAEQTVITVTPVHNSAKSSAPDGAASSSNGMANLYAGDLAARPQPAQHNSVAVDTPTIDSAPKDVAGPSSNAGLGSLVGGTASNLPAPPKPADPEPLVRGGVVVSPRLLHRVDPTYPTLATSTHVEGDVEIQAVIDQTGKVTSTKVISGPTLLRAAAMEAVRQWKYSPATLDGKPITMQYKVTVRFRLGQ